ncbi:hypothetical protein TOPH_04589 [Tolypocladium ophioglossoides CBS 100239]|uniref:Ribosomal RNA methyltransferase FtsJ domain-containing protein n=1 Tax=Tolypocladium ophioglossoides (strain CBS 100239) TaxID=1163406 RepID=A0A0L0N9J0_TOLOC|nr:hypothetical protein TOPH_04589 [Tolypocladium ophioglossoides CBS 100239]
MATFTPTQAKEALESGYLPDDPRNARVVEDQAHDDVDQNSERASKIIVPYLLERVAEFRELSDLRQKGWNNPDGDAFFRRQRRSADKCNERTAVYFYKLMKGIGEELHQTTNAFVIQQARPGQHSILDMCMAPGGFLATALNKNPGSRALAFSLPISSGGHKVRLPKDSNVDQRFLDVTMLAADMGVGTVPEGHPDAGNFLSRQFGLDQLFDLVLCDGQVLRTHVRAPYREKREARRLTTTQLALGLEHLRPSGTMIVLLHKLEAWDTVNLLWRFHKFSSVRLFKPKTGHATRSSFYMIATDIQVEHPEAVRAIEGWKAAWRVATFSSDEEYRKVIRDSELSVDEMLDDFGSELARLGREIWKVQADALAKAPFIRDRKAGSG